MSGAPDAAGRVVIYTDGGCIGNPGPGGWAAILRYNGHEKELTGRYRQTTNNRMELSAAIAALSSLKRPCKVVLYSDSNYLVKGMQEWLAGWKRNNWKRKNEPVLNRDLWEELDAVSASHEIEWVWVRGHAGNELNEACDRLAAKAIEEQRASANYEAPR